MAKDTYWFPHDFEPTSDPKIQALIKEFDWAGYGIYWRLVEMLHSEESHKLPKKNYLYLSLASKSFSAKDISLLVDSCINTFELFESDDNFFWSKRAFRNIKNKEERHLIKAESGRLGGIKSGESRRKQNEASLQQNEASLNKNEASLIENKEINSKNAKQNRSTAEAPLKQNEQEERRGEEIREEEKKEIKKTVSVVIDLANNTKPESLNGSHEEKTTHTQNGFDFNKYSKILITSPDYLAALTRQFPWSTQEIATDEMHRFVLYCRKKDQFPVDAIKTKAEFESFFVNSKRNPRNKKQS